MTIELRESSKQEFDERIIAIESEKQ